MNETFLYDTYALMEIMNKNSNYKPYIDKKVIINEFIFSEFCYNLLRDKVKNPKEYLDELELAIIRPDAFLIWEAMKFRHINKKKKFSMTDCISYMMSKKIGVKFLTGDKEFNDLDNVEFVK